MNCNSNKLMIATIILVIASAGLGYVVGKRTTCSAEGAAIVGQHCDLRHSMVRLWTDHVIWTRACIVATMNATPDEHAVHQRLLKNQEDLGSQLAHYYGNEAGATFTKLLKDHSTIMHDSVLAAKSHDQGARRIADEAWRTNEEELVKLLSHLNSQYWPASEMKAMFDEHLSLITQEIDARLHDKWATDITIFDAMCDQARKMARMFADGIVDQHPEKF